MIVDEYGVPQEDRLVFLKFMALVVRADKVVEPEERQAIDGVISAWGIDQDQAEGIYEILENGGSITALASQFRHRKTPYLLLQELITLAFLDGSYEDREKKAVMDIASACKVGERRVLDLEQWVREGMAWRERGALLVTPEEI